MSETENSASANSPQQVPQTETRPAGPGAQLAAYRQERGLTIEQVASQLNLAPRQIHALENDNYAALPGLVIARGFVRAYAKLLKVDAAPLVALIGEESPVAMDTAGMQRALAESLSGSELPKMRREASSSPWLYVVPAVLIVALGGWVAHTMGMFGGNSASAPVSENTQKALPTVVASASISAPQEQAPVQSALQADTNADSAVAVPQNLPAADTASKPVDTAAKPVAQKSPEAKPAEKKAADAGTANINANSNNAKVATPQVVETKPVEPKAPPTKLAEAKAPEAAKAPAPAKSAAPMFPATAGAPVVADSKPAVPTSGNIVLKVNQDSWVEIRRADKTVLISRVLKAGSTEAFDITQPGTLVVGNAAGVDVTVRGKPLDLKPIAKTNVARVNLK